MAGTPASDGGVGGNAIALAQRSQGQQTQQNEVAPKSFGTQLGLGALAALGVSMPLAMGVTVFDRSVIQFANGSVPSLSRALGAGFLNVFRSPVACMLGKDNLAVFTVYGATYMAKNSAEISADHYQVEKFWPVFFASTFVNSGMGLLKDRFLATMFGKGPATFPLNSYISFIARDSVIVGASFNGPTIVSPWLQKATGHSADVCDVVAQLGCPAAAQIVGTPLHMLGLHYYNTPQPTSLGVRLVDAIKQSAGPIGARMVRQVYVFGFGSIVVKKINHWVQNR